MKDLIFHGFLFVGGCVVMSAGLIADSTVFLLTGGIVAALGLLPMLEDRIVYRISDLLPKLSELKLKKEAKAKAEEKEEAEAAMAE